MTAQEQGKQEQREPSREEDRIQKPLPLETGIMTGIMTFTPRIWVLWNGDFVECVQDTKREIEGRNR